jgi:sodium/pantothenate symporter
MFLLFTIASFLVVAHVVDGLGGFSATIEGLAAQRDKPGIASWHGVVGPGTEWPTPKDYLIWQLTVELGWGFSFAVSPWQSSRHLIARDEHVVIRAAICTCLAVIFVRLVGYGGGGLMHLVNPAIEPSETVLIQASKHPVPQFPGALLRAGIMASALSSVSTFLFLPSLSQVTYFIGTMFASRPGDRSRR